MPLRAPGSSIFGATAADKLTGFAGEVLQGGELMLGIPVTAAPLSMTVLIPRVDGRAVVRHRFTVIPDAGVLKYVDVHAAVTRLEGRSRSGSFSGRRVAINVYIVHEWWGKKNAIQ